MKSNIKKVETCCNNCGSAKNRLITEGREHEYDNTTDDVFRVVQCEECGLAYLSPRPDVSEMGVIYPENYYAYSLAESDGQSNNFYGAFRKKCVMRMLEGSLKAFFGDERRRMASPSTVQPQATVSRLRVLDVGCGDGYLLNCLKALQGYEVETHGIEMNAKAAAVAEQAGHVVVKERFEEAELPAGYFDVVFASHVIEHVADPRAFALKVREVLKPGGIFAFWTPNIDSVEAKWFQRQHWGQYHFPRHWHFYSPRTVRKLAELTGFEFLGVTYAPNGVSWIYTFHSMCKSNAALSRYADALFPIVGWSKTTPLNFVRNGLFVGVELVLQMLTGQTSNMGVAFRKPA